MVFELFFLTAHCRGKILLWWTQKLKSLSFAWLLPKLERHSKFKANQSPALLSGIFREDSSEMQIPHGKYSCWNKGALNSTLRNLQKVGLTLPLDRRAVYKDEWGVEHLFPLALCLYLLDVRVVYLFSLPESRKWEIMIFFKK